MKDSIKREQSQAGLSFAERLRVGELCSGMRKNFRPKVKKNKLLLLLALLAIAAAATGPARAQSTSSLVFEAACNGSGTANDNVVWTVTSDGSESTFDNTKGIHYGTSKATVGYIELSTSGISGTITQVVVNASTASGVNATVGVTVGGNAFGGDAQSLTTSAKDYTFTGSASGAIVVRVAKPSAAAKALYVKSIEVTYTSSGGSGATYSVTMKDGVKDADKWTASTDGTNFGALPIGGLKGDGSETVTLKYNGRLKVKGVKATSDAAPAEEPVTLATPLTIEAITDGTIKVYIDGTLSTGMKYSVNGGTKTLITTTTDIEGLKAGDKVQFYGNGTQTQAYGNGPVVSILGSGDGFQTKVYGNIMSLLDETGFATKTELPEADYVFYGLFVGNTTLIDASELLLPATTLTDYCYYGMFLNCTNLTTAPKLPATTLAKQCYYCMFTSCTSLTSAYVKAAYTGGNGECTNMFDDCTATGAVLHTTSDNKASWQAKMGTGKQWETWTVADDWQE